MMFEKNKVLLRPNGELKNGGWVAIYRHHLHEGTVFAFNT